MLIQTGVDYDFSLESFPQRRPDLTNDLELFISVNPLCLGSKNEL